MNEKAEQSGLIVFIICYRVSNMYNYFENKIIHIISRSGLGYVGKLHSIDTTHNTVTLSKGILLITHIFVSSCCK